MADVAAEKDGRTVAVEIEWPKQEDEDLWRRHRRYGRSEVEMVWLLRQPEFPVSPDLPAACIGGDVDKKKGLRILVPTTRNRSASDRRDEMWWKQALSPAAFFRGLFEHRLAFGLPLGPTVPMGLETNWLKCRHCERTTRIVAHLVAEIGPHQVNRGLGLADDVPRLRERIREAVAGNSQIGEVRTRGIEPDLRHLFGETRTENTCVHCGRTVDRLHHNWSDPTEDEPVAEIELELEEEALAALEGRGETWAVWDEIPMGARLPRVVGFDGRQSPA